MIGISLFICAIVVTVGHMAYKKEAPMPKGLEIFLSYILFFTMGLMGLLAGYAHIFMGPEIARSIGWAPGSPFQYEIGMANIAFGVLGILSYWYRGAFWDASIIGWAVLLLGCFVGHVINFYQDHNSAPYNIGPYIWFYDLFLPLLALALLYRLRFYTETKS